LSKEKETSEEVFEENSEVVTEEENEDMVSLKKTAEVASDDTVDDEQNDKEESTDDDVEDSDKEDNKDDENSDDDDKSEDSEEKEDIDESEESTDDDDKEDEDDSDDENSDNEESDKEPIQDEDDDNDIEELEDDDEDEYDDDEDIDKDLLESEDIKVEEDESKEQVKPTKKDSKKSKFKKIWSNSQDELDNKKEKDIANILSYLKIIVVAFILAYLINTFILSNTVIPSSSMENTIMKNDRLFGFRWAYSFSKPERGDIIIFKYPGDDDKEDTDKSKENYIKRVIGLPGEKVEIKSGVVYVNDEKLEEDYLKEAPRQEDFGPYNVPEDSYFVLGDNRNNSRDARYWNEKNTYVHKDQIVAKAIFKYYPKIEFM